MQKPGGRDTVDVRRARGIRQRIRSPAADEGADRCAHDLRGVFAGHREQVLAVQLGRNVGVAQDLVQRLFDEFGLSFLDHQHRFLAAAEVDHLAVDDRVGHVHHIERHARLAPDIGKSGLAQRRDDAVIHAALHDDADIVDIAFERLVHAARVDEFDRGRPAVLDLLLLVQERGRRQHDAVGVARRLIERAGKWKGGPDIARCGVAKRPCT